MITPLVGALLFATSASLSAATSQFLKRAAGRTEATGGLFLRAANTPISAAARTLRTLDTNRDGLVEPSEVSAFAHLQGLDVATATKEFAGVDQNGDGNLDANELASALTGGGAFSSSEPVQLQAAPAQEAPQMQQIPVQQQAAVAVDYVEAPVAVAKHPAAAEVRAAATEVPAAASIDDTASAGAAKTSSLVAAAAAAKVVLPAPAAAPATAALQASQEALSGSAARAKAASEMVKQIAIEEKRTKEAETLEQEAVEVRANASIVARKFVERATEESSKAAAAKAQQILAQISDLEHQARKAEVKAAQFRAGMNADLMQATEQMGVATAAFDPLRSGLPPNAVAAFDSLGA